MTTRSKQSRSRQRSPTDAQLPGRSNEDRSRTHSRANLEDDGAVSEMSDDVVAPVDCDIGDPASLASFLSLTLAAQGQKSNRKQAKAMERNFATQTKVFDGKLRLHASEKRRFVKEQLQQHEKQSTASLKIFKEEILLRRKRAREKCRSYTRNGEKGVVKEDLQRRPRCPGALLAADHQQYMWRSFVTG